MLTVCTSARDTQPNPANPCAFACCVVFDVQCDVVLDLCVVFDVQCDAVSIYACVNVQHDATPQSIVYT